MRVLIVTSYLSPDFYGTGSHYSPKVYDTDGFGCGYGDPSFYGIIIGLDHIYHEDRGETERHKSYWWYWEGALCLTS